ncbi:SUN domain-containing ossification factor-like isoform X2 [Tachypleus tridentatus]|uniref:SUN domain-containing ossification factor-like isoform X2 n=1 Tax=Tachypleus tridentatus TaxID=6853 RepID=UPI003FD332D4
MMKLFKVPQVLLYLVVELLLQEWCVYGNREVLQAGVIADDGVQHTDQLSVHQGNEGPDDTSEKSFSSKHKVITPVADGKVKELEVHTSEMENEDINQFLSSEMSGERSVSPVVPSVYIDPAIHEQGKTGVEDNSKLSVGTSGEIQENIIEHENNSSQFSSAKTTVVSIGKEKRKLHYSVSEEENLQENISKTYEKNTDEESSGDVDSDKDERSQLDGVTETEQEPDVMPSFDEWKRMMLAEQERGGMESSQDMVPGKKLADHKRKQNYASYECGSKVVGANPEAEGKGRILNDMTDEYMLNPCNVKIWFVIELCESIQVNQIELANFELFSSMPKEFSVYWSDRYPTRDWTLVGNYEAENRRVLQSFPLQQTGYGKFIKIELHSQYGTEHYCPLSTVRVFGKSMVEEYEEMETAGEHSLPVSSDDDDRLGMPGSEESPASINLFGSARDAVINIVRKAASVLSGKEEQEEEVMMTTETPAEDFRPDIEHKPVVDFSNHSVKTVNLSATEFEEETKGLISHLFVCGLCDLHLTLTSDVSSQICRFLQVVLGPQALDQLCRLSSVHLGQFLEYKDKCEEEFTSKLEGVSVTTTSMTLVSFPSKSASTSDSFGMAKSLFQELPTHYTSKVSSSVQPVESPIVSHILKQEDVTNIQENIQPTKTIPESQALTEKTESQESGGEVSMPDRDSEGNSTSYSDETEKSTVSFNIENIAEETVSPASDRKMEEKEIPLVEQASANDTHSTRNEDALSDQDKDLNKEGVIVGDKRIPDTHIHETRPNGNGHKYDPVMLVGVPTQAGQKESVFMRLSNRIKALELNMSLSSRYLEELSQRYRRHMEEMQKAFDRTVGALNDTAADAANRDLHQQETIGQLQAQVINLTEAVVTLMSERDTIYRQILETHVCFLAIQLIILATVLSLCLRRFSRSAHQPAEVPGEAKSAGKAKDQRRLSAGPAIGYTLPKTAKKRRPSDEAMISGTYLDLVIVEPSVPLVVDHPPLKPKRKQKNKKHKETMSVSTLELNNLGQNRDVCRTVGKQPSFSECTSAAGLLFSHTSLNKVLKPLCQTLVQNQNIKASDKKCIVKEGGSSNKPLHNITNGVTTNGSVCNGLTKIVKKKGASLEKERFSFRNLLRLQRKE